MDWEYSNRFCMVFLGGFQLPKTLTVLSRMSGQYGDYATSGTSPLPMFAVVGAVVLIIWSRPVRTASTAYSDEPSEIAVLNR